MKEDWPPQVCTVCQSTPSASEHHRFKKQPLVNGQRSARTRSALNICYMRHHSLTENERFLNQGWPSNWQDIWGKHLLLTLSHTGINCRLIRAQSLKKKKKRKKREEKTVWFLYGERASKFKTNGRPLRGKWYVGICIKILCQISQKTWKSNYRLKKNFDKTKKRFKCQ